MKKSQIDLALTQGQVFKYSIAYAHQFKKDFVMCEKQHLDLKLIEEAVQILASTGRLPEKYKSHKLKGSFAGIWECHITSDWLMTWLQEDDKLTLLFLSTGSHSYLLGM
jgi:mRNA interferase YafQ